jgi:hypothetical protein
MRWWTGGWVMAAALVLAACTTSGGGPAPGPSGNRSSGPSAGASTHPSPTPASSAPASPTGNNPSAPATVSPPASARSCASGHTEVVVEPGDPAKRTLCVRPGTLVSLVLRPRVDDKRWTSVQSSAPVFVLPSGWRREADGTARASLRCAGTRMGSAKVTALAKAPDVAGAARVAFTLEVSVAPYPREG